MSSARLVLIQDLARSFRRCRFGLIYFCQRDLQRANSIGSEEALFKIGNPSGVVK